MCLCIRELVLDGGELKMCCSHNKHQPFFRPRLQYCSNNFWLVALREQKKVETHAHTPKNVKQLQMKKNSIGCAQRNERNEKKRAADDA